MYGDSPVHPPRPQDWFCQMREGQDREIGIERERERERERGREGWREVQRATYAPAVILRITFLVSYVLGSEQREGETAYIITLCPAHFSTAGGVQLGSSRRLGTQLDVAICVTHGREFKSDQREAFAGVCEPCKAVWF